MAEEDVERIRSWARHFSSRLPPADLRLAFFDNATNLNKINIGDENYGFVRLADVHWGGVNLSVIKWSQVSMLGDEQWARHRQKQAGKLKDRILHSDDYEAAIRANRQLAVTLQAEGLNEESVHFAHRTQVLQRHVWRRQRNFSMYLSSLFLDGLANVLAGYGYRPLRSILIYLLMITCFAIAYFVLGSATGSHLSWNEALVISLTAFHGRGFFPGQFQPGDPQAAVAAFEAVLGLLIEISFIAIFTKRFFFGG